MMSIHCPHCQSKNLVKQGLTGNGTQKWQCKRIKEADARVDRAIVGMGEAVRSFMHHFDPAMVAVTESLNNRLTAFGRISRKSYEEEIAIVNLLIAVLNTPEYSSKIAMLGLSSWLSELQTAETEFELLLGQRSVEAAQKPQRQLTEIRRRIDILYHKMIDHIHCHRHHGRSRNIQALYRRTQCPNQVFQHP
ncbi:MAG: DUF6261 family protein [Prevotellaceae bacterium]|jgi:DNA-directed RNA polymerase subunit RPC12/RpoP|nr:DUF6261 family protein [Prevotellaceae bacterium]